MAEDRDHRGVEVERDTLAEHVECDDLHVVRLVDRAAPAERESVDRLLRRGHAAGFHPLEESVLAHPLDELIGMISFLEGVFREDALVSLVPAERVAQAERLRELARLVNELMDPSQIVRMFDSSEPLEERTCLDLCAVSFSVFEQPVHKCKYLSRLEQRGYGGVSVIDALVRKPPAVPARTRPSCARTASAGARDAAPAVLTRPVDRLRRAHHPRPA